MTARRVKLTGGPEKTATWIWLEPETGGKLKVEYYDFSEPAHKFFGNDIAWTITVQEMNKLFSMINKDETSILPWMEKCFRSYFGIKQWLEENEIDFSIERESWA